MTVRIKELQERFDKESNYANMFINGEGSSTINTDFPSIIETYQEVTVGSTGGTSIERITKYSYKGILCDSYAIAKSMRNREIDSAIQIVNAKISRCESLKQGLENLQTVCNASLVNLRNDLNILNNLKGKFESYQQSVNSINSQYSSAISNLKVTFRCKPETLISETSNAMGYIQNTDFSNSSINDGISKIGDYIQQVNEIIAQITIICCTLASKKTALVSQRNNLENMKT